ncbi:unnamed protein product, partial [Timema podura]|nr:unnamed protein product [Timema podura]
NRYGMVNDEEIFASKEVTCQGQVIGAIVAKNQLIGQQAAKLVNVEYEVLDDVIVTLEDAIGKKSYFPGFPTKLTRGDIDQAFAESDHQICGEVRIGGQEHFYLETQTCIAVPKGEDDELELFCSTQNPTELQIGEENKAKVTDKHLDNWIACRVAGISLYILKIPSLNPASYSTKDTFAHMEVCLILSAY